MEIKIGTDFSGVGSVIQALNRLEIKHKEVFACEMDKYARKVYVANYGKPDYYPANVYDRDIPEEPLDLYVTTPPCQSFSIAGDRKGENDDRGILFYNSHEFIYKNNPRYVIFENVEGLLSSDNGRTFSRWIDLLGGKSVNGNPVIFPHEKSVPYHIYYKVLNSKNYNVPQNRSRIFILMIRNDADNNFVFPKEVPLVKNIGDIKESFSNSSFDNEDEFKSYLDKYTCSEKLHNWLINHYGKHKLKGNGFKLKIKTDFDILNTITDPSKNRLDCNWLPINSANNQGYELATVYDSINLEFPNSNTRRGRVGKGVLQTLTTGCNQGVIYNNKIRKITPREAFRGMDFPDSFDFSMVSDSQAFKQAGNSVVVKMFELLISKLKFD